MKMITCKKCSSEFPSAIVIDGKRRNLSCRSYCLDCSPWGQNNSRRLSCYDGDSKRCSSCKEWKHLDKYYQSRNGYSGQCRDCYSETYRADYRTVKDRAVAYKGGVCVDCKQTFPSFVYDFHHLNPKEKDLKLGGSIKKLPWDLIVVELDKCVLLCANCHRIRHYS